jgi:hypothetical protein
LIFRHGGDGADVQGLAFGVEMGEPGRFDVDRGILAQGQGLDRQALVGDRRGEALYADFLRLAGI